MDFFYLVYSTYVTWTWQYMIMLDINDVEVLQQWRYVIRQFYVSNSEIALLCPLGQQKYRATE